MAQPQYHILKKYANGVMDQKGKFYPFQIAVADIAAQINARYYVDKVLFNAIQEGDIAHAHLTVTMTVEGIATTITTNVALGKVDVITSSLSQEVDIGLLGDVNTAVDLTSAGVAGNISIKYAQVNEIPGEYQG